MKNWYRISLLFLWNVCLIPAWGSTSSVCTLEGVWFGHSLMPVACQKAKEPMELNNVVYSVSNTHSYVCESLEKKIWCHFSLMGEANQNLWLMTGKNINILFKLKIKRKIKSNGNCLTVSIVNSQKGFFF